MGSPPTMENSMAINTDGYDYSYFSTLKFGSEGYELWMLIDTGAANTWVMGSNCTSKACQRHRTFGADHSTSLAITNIPWNVTYGTGSVNVPTIMQVLANAKLLKKNILGVNLQRSSDGATDGQITFGDIDKTKFTGDISYAKALPDAHRWEIPV